MFLNYQLSCVLYEITGENHEYESGGLRPAALPGVQGRHAHEAHLPALVLRRRSRRKQTHAYEEFTRLAETRLAQNSIIHGNIAGIALDYFKLQHIENEEEAGRDTRAHAHAQESWCV